LNANQVEVPGVAIANDVTLSLTAASVSAGDFFDDFINNLDGGSIGGAASLNVSVAGAINAQTDIDFEIDQDTAIGTASSSIGSDASVLVNAGSISGGTLLGQIVNQDGATIGGNADLSFVVAGAITSGDTATFRIVNLDDGAGLGGGTINGDATINVDAATLSAATLLARINSLGGTIVGNSSITFGVTGALTTTGDATFEILQDTATSSAASVTVTASSYNIGGSLVARISDGETSFDVANVAVNATNDITVAGSLSIDGNVTAGGNISAAGGIFTPGDPITVMAGGTISAPAIATGSLIAGSDITVDNTAGTFTFGIIANTISTGGVLHLLNVPTISPNDASSDGTAGITTSDFSLTAASLLSTGPTFPLLTANGSDSDPNVANGNPGNGGNITINITSGGLNIGPTDSLTQIIANGGLFASNSTAGGNGGTINITATEDVNVNGEISADSGANPKGTPAGNGGTANIATAGTITVNSSITTSSNGSDSATALSAKGGNINLTSSRPNGVAINIGNSGQLLALLDQAAPGPGGKITILATGAGGSNVTVNGTVEADRGTVDIRHTGVNGTVNLGDAGTNAANLRGDIVKVGALGNNGVLTVGQGSLNADSVLKLYAPASNGQINFIANVTLTSGTDAILAANTLTIQPSVVVNIQGNGGPAQVFTNHPNYSGFGGTNRNNGTFGGNGANEPLPLSQAPPFDGPPGG
jgi:hypothetical protein